MPHARGPDTGVGYTEYVYDRPVFVTPEGRRYDFTDPEQLRAYYAEVYSRSPGVTRAYEEYRDNLSNMSRLIGQANNEAASLHRFANQLMGSSPQEAMELLRSARFYESEAGDYYDRMNRLVEDYLSRQGIPQNAEKELRAILSGAPVPGAVPTTTAAATQGGGAASVPDQTQVQSWPDALSPQVLEQLRNATAWLMATPLARFVPGLDNILSSLLFARLLSGDGSAAAGNTGNLPYSSLRAACAVDPLLYWHMINANRLGYRYPYYPVFNIWR